MVTYDKIIYHYLEIFYIIVESQNLKVNSSLKKSDSRKYVGPDYIPNEV